MQGEYWASGRGRQGGALCKTIEAACKVSTGRQGGGVRAVLCVKL